MYLYCISDGQGFCKFGYSEDPHRRLIELQTGNANSLHLVEVLSVDNLSIRDYERNFHREFQHRRVKGEWFRCSSSEGRNFLIWYGIRYSQP